MALPLFDDPPAPTITKRGGVGTPMHFAFRRGFVQGAQDQAASRCYDADPEVHAEYLEGHKVGRLFRPLQCMAEKR